MSDYVTVHTACGEAYDYARMGEMLSDSMDVRSACTMENYFSPDTLRFFGARNFATVAPGVSVELQEKAPGDRYKVTAWRVSGDGAEPWFGCWHSTRREAVACARRSSALLSVAR